MAQNTLTASVIAAEAVMILENSLVMAKKVHRGYEDEFDKKVNGYQVGESISIRRPTDFTIRTGAVAAAQEVKEGKLTFTVNTQKGVDFKFTSKDLTMNIKDLSDRIMKPALVQLANEVDRDVMSLYKKVPNWAGTPGQLINSFADFYKGPELLNELAVPEDERCAVLSPADHAALLGTQTGLFITGPAEGAYRRAKLGSLGDVDTYMSQNVPTHTTGTRDNTTPLTNGANQNVTYETAKDTTPFSQTLITDGWDAAATIKAGDVFTVAGWWAVNPVSKTRLSFLRQFTVVNDATADGGGNATLTISPAVITSGAFKTVDADSMADGLAITNLGAASTNFRQNMVFHKNAFGLVMVPMVDPPGAVDVSRKTHKGTSVRVIPVYDGINDFSMWRLDILYGIEAIDPRLATRLSGTA